MYNLEDNQGKFKRSREKASFSCLDDELNTSDKQPYKVNLSYAQHKNLAQN